ncbi:MAG TPA: GNAT family N-acetyltransferase [Thermomicrobiales bacterium]|nr:GNAT family N-acetyltransferase [Thermomicrobiales bacterium]
MAGTSIRVVPMRADQRERAAEVFARAFLSDPAMVATFPDSDERTRVMRVMGNWNIRLGETFGEVFVTAGEVDGVLTLFSSEREEELEEQIFDTYGSMPDEMGPEAWERNEAMGRLWEIPHEAMKAAVAEPHWYLDLLAVDPDRQGMGIGSTLLQVVNARSDADGRPCALFTFTERNVGLYQRHGYEIVAEGEAPLMPLHYWCLKRPSAR